MTGVIAALFVVACPNDEPVRVTVVVVLANTTNNTVDPKLVELAKEVQLPLADHAVRVEHLEQVEDLALVDAAVLQDDVLQNREEDLVEPRAHLLGLAQELHQELDVL